MKTMTIDIFMAEMCGSYYQLRANVDRAMADLGIAADVTYHTITYDDAISRDIKGSPSIWINGKDAFEDAPSAGIS